MSSIGHHITKCRKAQGMTQNALGEQLHVTRQTVSSWETGRTMPDIEMLIKIAESLIVPGGIWADRCWVWAVFHPYIFLVPGAALFLGWNRRS